MTGFERLVRQPQTLWLRKALFQIHLWTGLAIGVYLLVVSVSGSLVVFRVELVRRFDRRDPISAGIGPRLNEDGLKRAAVQAYPGFTVTRMFESKNPRVAVSISMSRGHEQKQRLFDPYTGADLGNPLPPMMRAISFVIDLHDNLLLGDAGRAANGVGSALLVVLCLTGAAIWWPGIGKWRRSLTVQRRAGWKRLNWDLHSAIGFWTLLLVAVWAVSGVYLVFPNLFNAAVDRLSAPGQPGVRPGDVMLLWLARLHFGRYWGLPTKVIWTVLGLTPGVLFVTGAVMWWGRVLKPALRQMSTPPDSLAPDRGSALL